MANASEILYLGTSSENLISMVVTPGDNPGGKIYVGRRKEQVNVRPAVFSLLHFFGRNPNQVIPRKQTVESTRIASSSLDVTMRELRGAVDPKHRVILTLLNIGHFAVDRFRPLDSPPALPTRANGTLFGNGRYALHPKYDVIIGPTGPILLPPSLVRVARFLITAGTPQTMAEVTDYISNLTGARADEFATEGTIARLAWRLNTVEHTAVVRGEDGSAHIPSFSDNT